MKKLVVIVLFACLIPLAYANQGNFTNSGGSATSDSGVVLTSNVAAPAGALTLNCPAVGEGGCVGGSFAFLSTDTFTSMNASFTSGAATETCSGGGKGGHVTCGYSLTANFTGTVTLNGVTQAIVGITSQAFTVGGSPSGTTTYHSAYSPFYYTDTEQILRSDDLQGTNQISFGSQGSGVGQFYGAYGIALDANGRIYVADTYNCRIVRFDDMNGANWTTYGGTCGGGQGQFADPTGIAIDSAGKIYIMDSENFRVVRMDDMTGANWISYGAQGTGVGQFSAYLTSVAVDSTSHIYVADTGNTRVVRFDDMMGVNWTTLTQSAPVNGVSYSFYSPAAVAIDSAGKIYVADNKYYAPAVVRMDDMTGVNWTSLYVSTSGSAGLTSISVDSGGTVFTGGGGVRSVDNMTGTLTSSGAVAPYGTSYVFGVTPVPVPSPRPSAVSLSPTSLTFSQNTGTQSATQPVTIYNFGTGILNLSRLAASSGFADTNNCPNQLLAGATCSVNVSFTPTVNGSVSGLLNLTDDSGNAGASQTVALTGTGTAPAASVTPATLHFSSQVIGTTSTARSIVVSNTGTGPLQISGIFTTAPFTQANTCAGTIAPAAACTIVVSFAPTVVGSVSAALTIANNAGTQALSLTGTGSSPVSFSSSSLSFGALAVGNTSSAKTLTLTNRGSALSFSSIVTSTPFVLASNACGTGIAAGASCTVGVTFTPTVTGSVTGTLTFADSALGSPQTVSLTGSGSAPVTLSTSKLSLGTVAVGSISSPKSVTLTNRLNVSLTFSSIATSADFALAGNTCGTSIAAGANCSVDLTFSPTSTGVATGTLTFSDNAASGTQTVSLTGTGR